MAKTYTSVPLDEEQPILPPTKESSFTTKLQYENCTLREKVARLVKQWIWVIHTILLSTSFLLFLLAFYMTRAQFNATAFTRAFSAWCKLFSILPSPFNVEHVVLIDPNSQAPALSVVKYEVVKFDLPPTMDQPSIYVGKGPGVDKAWEAITGDGTSRDL